LSKNKSVSPLAPEILTELPVIAGIRLGVGCTGTKYKDRNDVMIALCDDTIAVAGVFTTSKTASAPVDWCRDHVADGRARAIIVNAGNANAFTGQKGMAGVQSVVGQLAKVLDCPQTEVFAASTGVIGEPLDADSIIRLIEAACAQAVPDNWLEAARAIMTTDTFPKLATVEATIDGVPVRINGIAKGSGMIAPDMATMLSFIFTDAAIPAGVLQTLLAQSVEPSFNSISIDSDTSTSDTVLMFATGQAHSTNTTALHSADDPRLDSFREKLNALTLNLAHQIVRDGEGAQKFITITVAGAENDRAAKVIARSIADSPLVKTAIAGGDPNWGRIVMAVGKSGEAADRDRLIIWIGDSQVTESGYLHPGYSEQVTAEHMKGDDITIKVDVGIAQGCATVWTCDLTHGYIDINTDYRS
jgi:glutamate N-acetyltransferase / amino-acid N-acetyltransferase